MQNGMIMHKLPMIQVPGMNKLRKTQTIQKTAQQMQYDIAFGVLPCFLLLLTQVTCGAVHVTVSGSRSRIVRRVTHYHARGPF